LRDLFAYALENGLRHGSNPFEKIKIASKSKLEQQKRSYKPLTSNDLKTIFDPSSYTTKMNKAAYRWLPFLALYSGRASKSLRAFGSTSSNARAMFGSSTSRRRRTRTHNAASLHIASSSNRASSPTPKRFASAAKFSFSLS
jgi:hypothetical protein